MDRPHGKPTLWCRAANGGIERPDQFADQRLDPRGGLTSWIVRLRSTQPTKRFDWGGQLTSIVMLGALCFAAIELPERGGGSSAVRLAAAIAVGAALGWFLIEGRTRDPMVPLVWFRNPAFLAANLVGCLVYVGYFGMLFILSLYLHGDYGLDAGRTGLALLPVAASLSVGNVIAGRLQAKVSPRRLIAGSLILAALFRAPGGRAAGRPCVLAGYRGDACRFRCRHVRFRAAGDRHRARAGSRGRVGRRIRSAERAAPDRKLDRRRRRERRLDADAKPARGSMDRRGDGCHCLRFRRRLGDRLDPCAGKTTTGPRSCWRA